MKWLSSLFAPEPSFMPDSPPVEIVQSGICKHRGYLHLVHPEMADRGIKLVSIPADFAERFERVRIEWNQIQFELSKYPQSLRRRQRKVSAESDNG